MGHSGFSPHPPLSPDGARGTWGDRTAIIFGLGLVSPAIPSLLEPRAIRLILASGYTPHVIPAFL